MDVTVRSAQILPDELVNDDLDVKLPARKKQKTFDCCEIAPLVTVHGVTNLSIGRIKINMDQGYMCAYDEAEARVSKKVSKQLRRLRGLQATDEPHHGNAARNLAPKARADREVVRRKAPVPATTTTHGTSLIPAAGGYLAI
jgi:hypothetical protein